MSPNDETSPLLGHQRTGSLKTPEGNENSRKTHDKELHSRNLVWVLIAAWSALFLSVLDGTIVATLTSPIGAYFDRSNQSSYIGSTYLLSACCFTPIYGRLSDIIGRKGAMLLGLSLFGSGTLLCGIAPSMNTFITARAIAGLGGGGVVSVQSIILTDLIPLKNRGLYQGISGVVFSAGAGLGGPLGGWLNDRFGWRSAFLIQVPVLALSMALALINIPPTQVRFLGFHTKLKRIDFFGSLTLVPTVGCSLLGLSLKATEDLPWSHPLIWGLLSASGIWGVAFVVVELKIAAYPVMPIRLMRQRTPLAVALTNLFSSMGAYSMMYNVPSYFSAVRLNPSSEAGLHLLPQSISICFGGLFAGWVMRSTGKTHTLILVSTSLGIIGSALVALWDFNTSPFHLWLDLIPCGFGIASVVTATLTSMIANVAREDIAVATGITFLFRTTGQVLGVSLSGALLQAVLTTQLQRRITGPNAFEIIERVKHNTTMIRELPTPLKAAAIASYADASKAVFISQIVCNVLAFACSLPIQERPLPATMEEQERMYQDQQNGRNRNPQQNGSNNP